MIKIVCLFSRKPGMSMVDFRWYYEQHHAPLVMRTLPPLKDYRRNYAVEGRDFEPGHAAESRQHDRPFDVVTEITFENEQAFAAVQAALSDPLIGAIIARDEEQFLDRATMRTFFVDEHSS